MFCGGDEKYSGIKEFPSYSEQILLGL